MKNAPWKILCMVTLLALSAAVALAAEVAAVNIDAHGLAVAGYDPVAYFTDGKAVTGKSEFTAQHEGATYRFASAAHRDAFTADPDKYTPGYGGFCAYGVAKGAKAPIDPEAFSIVDGKLYLNYDSKVRNKWQQDTSGYIGTANANWPAVQKSAAELR